MRSADGGSKWDVFLAYASPDRAHARALYDALVTAGVRVFLDEKVLLPGDNWQLLVPQHLRAAEIIAVLISEHTDQAHYEQSEVVLSVGQVRREGRRLVPVRLADVEVPYGMEQLHRLDLFDVGVDAAAHRLAAVVPDRVVAPAVEATQVFCERVPLPPKFFTGRDELLAELGSSLEAGGTSVVTQAIQGLGGVGKTSLAAALVEARRHELDIVWWVRAEEPAQLVADLAELAPHIGVSDLESPADTAAAVRRRLETLDHSWLVVFDNVPDQAAVRDWLARRGSGAVVITSRSTYFPQADQVATVDTFPPTVAEQFLRNRAGRATEDLGPIIERLGGLPLALEQAAAWVARVPNRTFARFVERYDAAADDAFPDGTRPEGYEHTTATTWRISIDAAAIEAPLADQLMAVLSFFAPDELPCQWLRDAAADDYFGPAEPAAIDDALDALYGYSLIRITPGDTLSVHRVVQAVTRRSASDAAAAAAIGALRAQTVGDEYDPAHWPLLATLMPHVLALTETASQTLPNQARDLWRLLDDVVRYQAAIGAVHEALVTARMARAIATIHLDDSDSHLLASAARLASTYRDVGDLDQAIALYEATLTDSERIVGPDHPHTLTVRNNLGVAYHEASEFNRALSLFETTFTDRKRVLGPDHPETLTTRNNLAVAYQHAGDIDRALSLLETTLTDTERVVGPNHLDSLTSRNNLAIAYREAGDLDRAIELMTVAVAGREKVLGPDHPWTRGSSDALAEMIEEREGRV